MGHSQRQYRIAVHLAPSQNLIFVLCNLTNGDRSYFFRGTVVTTVAYGFTFLLKVYVSDWLYQLGGR